MLTALSGSLSIAQYLPGDCGVSRRHHLVRTLVKSSLLFVFVCVLSLIAYLTIDPETPDLGTQSAIEQLESNLNQNYLIAETLMSLRTPKAKDFNETLGKINQQYDELVGAMASVGVGSQAIVAVTNNKQEFDTRKDKWLTEIRGIIHEPNSPSTSVTQPNARSHCSTLSSCFKSKRSSTSSKLSFKRLQAEAKLKVAQLESLHLKERAEGKRKRELLIMESEQREAHRKIELTKIELQVYNEAYENTSGQTKHTASALECSKMDRPQSMADIKKRGPCVLSPPTTFATQSLPAVKTSSKSHFNQSALDTQMRLMEDQSNLAQFVGSSKEYEQARGSQFGQPLDIAQVADIVQEPPPVLFPDSACKYNSPLNFALGQPSFQPVTLPHVFESN